MNNIHGPPHVQTLYFLQDNEAESYKALGIDVSYLQICAKQFFDMGLLFSARAWYFLDLGILVKLLPVSRY